MDGTQIYRRRLWLLVFLVTAMALSLIVFAILTMRNNNANLEIIAAPTGVNIVVDGKNYSPGKISLTPGKHMVRAEKEGFETITQDVTVDESLKQVTFALTPKTAEAQKIAEKDSRLYDQVESIGGQLAQEQGQAFTNANPIVAKLPKNTSIYAINYTRDIERPGQVYIRIDSTSPAGRQAAIAQIRTWGFNPTDYRIVFAGLINPFQPGVSGINEGGL